MNRVIIKEQEKEDFRRREAFKTLRANIQFSGDNIKTVAITSTLPGEGKTSVALALARSFAEAGKFTVLVDCDIRRSFLAEKFEIQGKMQGLSEYLCGIADYHQIIMSTNQPSFYTVFTGRHVPNPSELLSGVRFTQLLEKLREDFEVVILDTPPVSSVIDGAIVASRCDGAVLVVASEQVSRRMVQRVKAQLVKGGVHILGVALNRVNTKKNSYYYYKYGYDKYGDYSEPYLTEQGSGEE